MSYHKKELDPLIEKYLHVRDYFDEASIAFQWSAQQKYHLRVANIKFPSIAKMHGFFGEMGYISIYGLEIPEHANKLKETLTSAPLIQQKLTAELVNAQVERIKTCKLVPSKLEEDYRPCLLLHAPIEETEGDYTYRIILGHPEKLYAMLGIAYIARNDAPIYDYLDKGHYLMRLSNSKWVVSDIYDIHTAHVFLLCALHPELAENLRHGCFIHSKDAALTRLKMEKKLPTILKNEYKRLAELIDIDYQQSGALVALNKLRSGEAERILMNDISLTRTSASYDNISIEAPGLVDVLYHDLNFGQEYDIYTICQTYAAHIGQSVERGNFKIISTDSHKGKDIYLVAELSINNIPIKVHCNNQRTGGVRYINNIKINKDEVAQALFRACCYHDSSEYALFLHSISRMSIRRHDIIANGLAVKIHKNITQEEYNNAVPSVNAPALRFKLDPDSGRILLKISEERAIPVDITKLIDCVDKLNERTNNERFFGSITGEYSRSWRYRNHEWCAAELTVALIKYTLRKDIRVDGSGVKYHVNVASITRADIASLLGSVYADKLLAIQRSREFLASAVEITGAEAISFMNRPAYKVQGALRTYVVMTESAKVYDYETKAYRCIVNAQHYVGVGYDDVAARLLALKNDSITQSAIATIAADREGGTFVPDADEATEDRAGLRALINSVV